MRRLLAILREWLAAGYRLVVRGPARGTSVAA